MSLSSRQTPRKIPIVDGRALARYQLRRRARKMGMPATRDPRTRRDRRISPRSGRALTFRLQPLTPLSHLESVARDGFPTTLAISHPGPRPGSDARRPLTRPGMKGHSFGLGRYVFSPRRLVSYSEPNSEELDDPDDLMRDIEEPCRTRSATDVHAPFRTRRAAIAAPSRASPEDGKQTDRKIGTRAQPEDPDHP